MKAQRLKLTTAALGAATLLFAPVATIHADDKDDANERRSSAAQQATSGADHGGKDMLRVASEDANRQNLRDLAGSNIRGRGGEDLGEIKDLLIQADSGKIAYVVVSSGGVLGFGETLRLLPAGSLDRAPGADGFALNIDQTRWDQLPALEQQHYDAGSIVIGVEQRRQMEEHLGAKAGDASDMATGEFVRATRIRGKDLRSGNQHVGEIEEVVVDLENRNATALLDPDNEFANTDQQFLVPLSRISFRGGEDDVATTTLTRADFEDARSRMAGTDTDAQRQREDTQLTPTGRTSGTQPQELEPALQSAAKSIRQLFDKTPSLEQANLEVEVQGGEIVLRGTVENEEMKEAAVDAAESAAPGIAYDNRIMVKNE